MTPVSVTLATGLTITFENAKYRNSNGNLLIKHGDGLHAEFIIGAWAYVTGKRF